MITMISSTKELGDIGESFAAKFLESKGYKILDRNFRFNRLAEIDIIAEIDDIIVFVEVKTRSSNKYGLPAEAVDIHKRQKIILAAKTFLQQNNFFNRSCRFDVIEVFANYRSTQNNWRVNHIENAFEVS